jgi:ABC-type glycerol-3-phosphate transport system substrate-binding protein
MRRSVKAVLMLVVAALLVAGISACGGDDSSSTSNGSASNGDSAKLSGTITIWDPAYKAYPGYTKAADSLDAEFEDLHPGVEITHVPQVYGKYDQALRASFTARKGPDVLRLNPGAEGLLQWTKGLEPLNDRITDEMRDTLSGWSMMNPDFTEDGEMVGVPMGFQGFAFYYNKKLFAKAGLPTDFQPTTWDEVKAAGEKLEAAGIQAFTGANKEGFENGWWFAAGWGTTQTHEDAKALARGETSWTDDAVKDALAPEFTMEKAGLFESDRYTTPVFPDGSSRFGEGKAGMYLGLWSIAAYYKDFIPKLGEDAFGVFFPPGDYVVGSPNNGWAIPTYAENKDAAWAYIEFVTSKHGEEVMYDVGGLLPNRDDVEIAADAPPQERAILEATRTRPLFPIGYQMAHNSILFTMYMEVNEALQGRKSLDAALEEVQATADKVKQ